MKKENFRLSLLAFLFVFSFSSYIYLCCVTPQNLSAGIEEVEIPDHIEHTQVDLPDLHLMEHFVKLIGKMIPAG